MTSPTLSEVHLSPSPSPSPSLSPSLCPSPSPSPSLPPSPSPASPKRAARLVSHNKGRGDGLRTSHNLTNRLYHLQLET